MKTTVLFTAALFLATASFAQTNVKSNSAVNGESTIQNNKVTSNENVSSETIIKTDAVTNARQKSSAEMKQEHKALATEKQSVAAKANEKGKKISAVASDKSTVAVEGNEKGQIVSSLASDGKSKSVNANSRVSEQTNASVNTKTIANKVKNNGKKIRTTSANTIHATTASAHAVKIKPVTVKTTTNAGVGINIK
jgi:hypothetical protein